MAVLLLATLIYLWRGRGKNSAPEPVPEPAPAARPANRVSDSPVRDESGVRDIQTAISKVHAKVQTAHVAAMTVLNRCIANDLASIELVETAFEGIETVTEEALNELTKIQLPAGIQGGVDIVEAMAAWIRSTSEFFRVDEPSLLASLKDDGLPVDERLARFHETNQELRPTGWNANLKLMQAQKAFLLENKVPVPTILESQIAPTLERLEEDTSEESDDFAP